MVFFEHYGIDEKDYFRYFTLFNYTFPLHFHRAYELIIVNEGEIVLTTEQKEYSLKKGDVAFIFNNQIHGFKTIDKSNISIVIFSPELIGHFFMKYKGFIPRNNVFHVNHLPDLKELDSIYKQKGFLYHFSGILVEHTDFIPAKYSTKTEILQKILLFVDNNYNRDCTLKDVAIHLKYDYAYLPKLFLQLTNMTFTEYLNYYRILQACYLLKNSQQSISDIAINCGYNNLRTFHRNFRKYMNCSPSKYREDLN